MNEYMNIKDNIENFTPLRGYIYIVDIKKVNNSHIQSGSRPCIVISNDKNNMHSPVVTVIPLTSSTIKNKIPTHVIIKPSNHNKLSYDSIALCESVFPVDKKLFQKKNVVGKLTNDEMEKIEKALLIQLGI